MPEPTSYAPGTPSWVDLASPDTDASARFYGELFGWNASEPGPVETTGGYRMFDQGGKPVAGLAPRMQDSRPPAWTTYISVASADETAAKVAEAGGQAVFDPMDVLDVGRMAMFTDPAGGTFSVWEPRSHIGSGIVNEPVSPAWNELVTKDPEAAKAFYGSVFGWGAQELTDGPMPYTLWMLGETRVAGMIVPNQHFPPEVPVSWGVYFAVEDVDATMSKAQELGGRSIIEPMDLPVGRMGSLTDPHGAFLSVITLAG
jgi:predicted enzyme related to lactoylglutathione lyase